MISNYFSEGYYTILICYFFFTLNSTTERLMYFVVANNIYTGPMVLFGTYFHQYVVYMIRFFSFVYFLHITNNDSVVFYCGVLYFAIIQVQAAIFMASKIVYINDDEDFYIDI